MRSNTLKSIQSINTIERSFARFTTTAIGLCAATLMLSHSIAADALELNKADIKFVEQESTSSINAIRLSEMAVEKSPSPEVKAFAEEVVLEQRKANKEIRAFASSRNVEFTEVNLDDNTRTHSQLDKSTIENFDKDYLNAVVKQNERSVKDFEKLSLNKDTDPDLKAWADQMLLTMRNQQARAEALRATLAEETASTSL